MHMTNLAGVADINLTQATNLAGVAGNSLTQTTSLAGAAGISLTHVASLDAVVHIRSTLLGVALAGISLIHMANLACISLMHMASVAGLQALVSYMWPVLLVLQALVSCIIWKLLLVSQASR